MSVLCLLSSHFTGAGGIELLPLSLAAAAAAAAACWAALLAAMLLLLLEVLELKKINGLKSFRFRIVGLTQD